MIRLEIVTPEKVAYSADADQVTLPTADGEITILAGHLSIVTKLVSGELTLKKNGQTVVLATGGGFAEVRDNKVVVVTDLAKRPEEVDEKTAEEARKRAQEAMKDRDRLSEEEYALTAATLEKALAQLKIKRKHAHGRRAS